MKKNKIYQSVLIGNLVINLPILSFFAYAIFFVEHPQERIHDLLLIAIVGSFYWSALVPWYRRFSIKRINSKKEYFFWKKLSIFTLLLWPDNFVFTKFEFWSDKEYHKYKMKKRELGII